MTGSALNELPAGEWNNASHDCIQTSRDTAAFIYLYLAGGQVTPGVSCFRGPG